jgi:hypothetical protein
MLEYKIQTNERGFQYAEFLDSYGQKCSVQKSSAATKDCIWIGIDSPKLTVFENDSKGKYIITEMPKNFDVHSRMHLTVDQVRLLLPILQHFADTGELI